MAVVTINGILESATLILVLVAIIITLTIILRTGKRLRSCYKFLLAALAVFAVLEFFDVLKVFQVMTLKPVFNEILEIAFVLLFILGLWNIRCGIRERQEIRRKTDNKLQKRKLKRKRK